VERGCVLVTYPGLPLRIFPGSKPAPFSMKTRNIAHSVIQPFSERFKRNEWLQALMPETTKSGPGQPVPEKPQPFLNLHSPVVDLHDLLVRGQHQQVFLTGNRRQEAAERQDVDALNWRSSTGCLPEALSAYGAAAGGFESAPIHKRLARHRTPAAAPPTGSGPGTPAASAAPGPPAG